MQGRREDDDRDPGTPGTRRAAALQLPRVGRVGRKRVGVERRRVTIEAMARREEIAQHDAQDERDRRHRFEIDQGDQPQPPDFFQPKSRSWR